MAFKLRAQGVLDYANYLDQQKALEQARQDKREALSFELMSKYGVGSFAGMNTKSGKASPDAVSFSAATKSLQQNYGLGDDVLAPILASGDKTAAPNLLKLLDDQRLKYEEQNLTLPDTVVNQIIEKAVITQPRNQPIDYTEIETYIGREMDSMLKMALDAGTQVPGQVLFQEPAFVETPDLEDLDKFERRAIAFNETRAEEELGAINIRLGEFTDLEIPAGSDLATERAWLSNRKTQIEQAQSAANKKIPSYAPLVALYGSTYTDQLLDSYKTFEDAPLNPALLNASQTPTQVPQSPNNSVLRSLIRAGVFKEGDKVQITDPNGNVIDEITITK